MTIGITRRDSLMLGAVVLGARSALAQDTPVTDVPMADVKPPAFEVEKGAELHTIRPAKFVDPDSVWWDRNTKKFTDTTGIPVSVNYISWEDLRPQTAVIANTGGGVDLIFGWAVDPFLYEEKLLPMNDLADYLGAKYGGWFDIAKLYGTRWKTDHWHSLPIGGGTGPTVYRMSWVKEAGYDKIPDDLDGFLELCRKLHDIGHPCGFSVGHAVGDANGFAEWALWSHNGKVVDESGKIALDSKETINALKYVAELYKVMIPGTIAWNDSGNNKAYIAGQIGLTFNGVSIYQVLKTSPDPNLNAMAKDTMHQAVPRGLAKRSPMTAGPMQAMLFKHTKYPNAAKEYIRFMMEAPQYGPWLANCLGYWSEPLKAYAKMKFWTDDPKLAPYANAMDTIYYEGYAGPVSAAASAVVANYTVVDMFASVATGNSTPEQAAKAAAKQAARYYGRV